LKTPNGYSDVIEKKWTDNAMTQRLTMVDKTLQEPNKTHGGTRLLFKSEQFQSH